MAYKRETSTTRAQRIGIWIIAVIMTVGTIGSFVVIVIANDNQQRDQKIQNELLAEYQASVDEYKKKVEEQGNQLSDKYYSTFQPYGSRVSAFDKGGVTELKTEDLVVGDGEALTAESTFTAYYIGWNPDGEIFDQSIDGEKLKAPLTVTPGSVIAGWTEGMVGAKVGGIRMLTIPSDKAYGASGSGDKIGANTPIRFIVFVIPTPEEIAQPEPSEELLKYYQ